MDNIFLLKLLLSFVIGGLWTVMATVVADKYGSKVGGLIAGLPSTGLFSLFFMGWTLGSMFSVAATTVMPAIIGVLNIFVVIYIVLARKNFWAALGLALMSWFVFALSLVFIQFNSYAASLILYAISLLLSYIVIEHFIHIPSMKGKRLVYLPRTIIVRGLLSGGIVVLAVVLGKIGGPILGGAFAGFPAVWTSTILITYFAHGAEFSVATMKSSLFSVVSLVIHTIMVRYTYVPLGIIWGTLVSMLVSFTSGFLVYKFVVTRLS